MPLCSPNAVPTVAPFPKVTHPHPRRHRRLGKLVIRLLGILAVACIPVLWLPHRQRAHFDRNLDADLPAHDLLATDSNMPSLLRPPLDTQEVAIVRESQEPKAAPLATPPAAKHSSFLGLFEQSNVFDLVTFFGAKGDGKSDDTAAMQRALAACKTAGGGVILIPKGYTVLLWPFTVRSNRVELRVEGNIVAPPTVDEWGPLQYMLEDLEDLDSVEAARMQLGFITAEGVTDFSMTGGGVVDGRGAEWWALRREKASVLAPVLVKLVRCHRVRLEGLALLNSPFYHVVADHSHHIALQGLRISAPSTSKNTDGITMIHSSHIQIRDCTVETGDDNCAIKEGSHDILVHGCEFLSGHGTSIGSLGEAGSAADVHSVRVSQVTFRRTQMAARIKTWQGGRGAVRNVTFDAIRLEDVLCPLVLDQFYCASSQHPRPCANDTSNVQIDSIVFRNITGTQTSGAVGQLLCSDSHPCTNVVLEDVDVRPAEKRQGWDGGKTWPWWWRPHLPNNHFKCWNAQGTAKNVSPSPCLNDNNIGHGVLSVGILSRGLTIGLTVSDFYKPEAVWKNKSASKGATKHKSPKWRR